MNFEISDIWNKLTRQRKMNPDWVDVFPIEKEDIPASDMAV